MNPTVEKIFHFEHTLRCVHVFVVNDSTHGRLVHSDVIGDITKDQWTQMLDTLVEELTLEVDNARRHLLDRLLTLVDRLD